MHNNTTINIQSIRVDFASLNYFTLFLLYFFFQVEGQLWSHSRDSNWKRPKWSALRLGECFSFSAWSLSRILGRIFIEECQKVIFEISKLLIHPFFLCIQCHFFWHIHTHMQSDVMNNSIPCGKKQKQKKNHK